MNITENQEMMLEERGADGKFAWPASPDQGGGSTYVAEQGGGCTRVWLRVRMCVIYMCVHASLRGRPVRIKAGAPHTSPNREVAVQACVCVCVRESVCACVLVERQRVRSGTSGSWAH